MTSKQVNFIYALRNNELVHISQVESGLACKSICPACGAPLIARKGSRMMHHFAHHNAEECKYGYETSLHLAAKEIIAATKRIWLPEVRVTFDYRSDELLMEATEIEVDDVTLEKILDTIIPDIIITINGKTLIIEIYVTHAIDDIKLKKIRDLNISTLEIDLSKIDTVIDESKLKEIIVGASSEKQWKYNSLAEQWKERFICASEEREIISRGYALHIDNCPVGIRHWRGKPYANFMHDCTGCQFFIADKRQRYVNSEDDCGSILCSGTSRIASVEDFKLTLEERKQKYDSKMDSDNLDAITSGHCPNCGGDLKQRTSRHGVFWGCNNYPHCRFTMSIDENTGEMIIRS